MAKLGIHGSSVARRDVPSWHCAPVAAVLACLAPPFKADLLVCRTKLWCFRYCMLGRSNMLNNQNLVTNIESYHNLRRRCQEIIMWPLNGYRITPAGVSRLGTFRSNQEDDGHPRVAELCISMARGLPDRVFLSIAPPSTLLFQAAQNNLGVRKVLRTKDQLRLHVLYVYWSWYVRSMQNCQHPLEFVISRSTLTISVRIWPFFENLGV